MAARSCRRSAATVTVLILVALIAVLAPGSRVAAHTELASSSPAEGTTVTTPVSSVSLTFNQGVEPTANPAVPQPAVRSHLTDPGQALYVVRPDGTGRLELRAEGFPLALGGIPYWTG